MFFTSDNASGAAPEGIAALARANEGFAPSYGADAIMARVQARIRDIFAAPEAAVYLVATGTAANASCRKLRPTVSSPVVIGKRRLLPLPCSAIGAPRIWAQRKMPVTFTSSDFCHMASG